MITTARYLLPILYFLLTRTCTGIAIAADTDDDKEKEEKLQMMVMKTAKGMTINDLITPRPKEKKSKKKALPDVDPMGACQV